jgi:cytochrome P450
MVKKWFDEGKCLITDLFHETMKQHDAFSAHVDHHPNIAFRKYEYADTFFNAPADAISKPNNQSFGLLMVLGKGKCVLFMETTEEWNKKRASVMKAFSFENLKGMSEIMKKSTIDLMQTLVKDGALNKGTFDIAPYLVGLSSSIVCESGFGESTGKILLDFITPGKGVEKKTIGAIIKQLSFDTTIEDQTRLVSIFFPYLSKMFKLQFKKETYINLEVLHQKAYAIIKERKEGMNNTSKNLKNIDLLTILLNDPMFANNLDDILAEIIAFFLAGSLTISAVIQNCIYYAAKYPEMQEKIFNEMKPFFNKKKNESDQNKLNYDDLSEFEYLTMFFKESLRIDPPVHFTSPAVALKKFKVGPYTMRAGDTASIHVYGVHRDAREWHSPEEFIPERFDSISKYYKTPEGKKRHPMSYIPFIAGLRNCLG